jgi:hypothetical protein
MSTIIPDLDWYTGLSERKGLLSRCPFASVNRCPRFPLHLSSASDERPNSRASSTLYRESLTGARCSREEKGHALSPSGALSSRPHLDGQAGEASERVVEPALWLTAELDGFRLPRQEGQYDLRSSRKAPRESSRPASLRRTRSGDPRWGSRRAKVRRAPPPDRADSVRGTSNIFPDRLTCCHVGGFLCGHFPLQPRQPITYSVAVAYHRSAQADRDPGAATPDAPEDDPDRRR